MKRFLLRAVPPRRTFAEDMTEAEREVMQEHVIYWTGLADRGTAIVFGPVLDPKGTWGVAIVQVEDEAELRAILTNDPAAKAGVLTNEIYPMGPGTVVRK